MGFVKHAKMKPNEKQIFSIILLFEIKKSESKILQLITPPPATNILFDSPFQEKSYFIDNNNAVAKSK